MSDNPKLLKHLEHVHHSCAFGLPPEDMETTSIGRAELLEGLRGLPERKGDAEYFHVMADKLLLRYIADDEVTEAFVVLQRWYA